MSTESRPYQFTLRSLLLVVTVSAVAAGWWAERRARIAKEETLLEPFRKNNARVVIEGNHRVVEIWLPLDSSANDRDLENLTHFLHLRVLDLWGSDFTEAALANLKNLSKLEYLHVAMDSTSGQMVTDAGLSHLRNLTSLRTLHLGPARVSDVGLRHLEGLGNLKDVCIWGLEATDQGLECFATLNRLETLSLFHNGVISGEGLQALPRPEILQGLSIYPVTDGGMRTITRFSNLRMLWIGGPDLTTDGLSKLREFKKLDNLWIQETSLDTHALEEFVSQLPKLRELHLMRCPLGETDIEPIRRLRQKGLTVSVEGSEYDSEGHPKELL